MLQVELNFRKFKLKLGLIAEYPTKLLAFGFQSFIKINVQMFDIKIMTEYCRVHIVIVCSPWVNEMWNFTLFCPVFTVQNLASSSQRAL